VPRCRRAVRPSRPRPCPPARQAAVTALARIAAAGLPPGADAPTTTSGFQLLPTGEFAFGACIALARRAELSLDLQLYHLHRDLAAHAGMQVRLFSPLPLRWATGPATPPGRCKRCWAHPPPRHKPAWPLPCRTPRR